MKKDLLTLIVLRNRRMSSHSLSSLTFHRRVVYYFVVGILLLVGFGASGSWSIRQNIAIRNRIASIHGDLDHLRGVVSHIDRIRKDEKIIRESLGIEALEKNYDINERLGKGGAEADDSLAISSLNIEKEIKEMVDRRPLHVRVHDLREDVHELLEVLSKMTVTLECRPTVMPVKDNALWISSGFGWRKSPFTGLRQFHKGLDISGRKGTKIISTADGKVTKVGHNRFIGNYVKIKHDRRFSTSYGHLWKHNVKKGQEVRRGDVVGFMGTTGMSTGYHLHYEVIDNAKKVNPHNFILNRHELSLSDSR